MPQFNYTQEQLSDIADNILAKAQSLGATSAQLEINESIDLDIEVLKGQTENVANSLSNHLNLTVYIGQNRGNVGITQLDNQNITEAIKHALDIAKYTQADPASGLAEPELLCRKITHDLQLYTPLDLDKHTLISKAKNIEQIAFHLSNKITNSEGAAISSSQHNFVIANTNGFNLGYQTSRYSASISLIGNTQDGGMQTDYWYHSCRDFADLISDKELANIATQRLLRRLTKGELPRHGTLSVVFEAAIAKSIIGTFLGAISGNNLYRRLSFLNDSLNTQVFPKWLNIIEDPFIEKGIASCYFDSEGVTVKKRHIVEDGIVSGYILSSYSARKLGTITTANAGGTHNILVNSNFNGDLNALIGKLDRGLVIIETIGHGLNMVTGDYSVGASGLWVEEGQVQFFVDNITIAGNFKNIFNDIRYIANDLTQGSIQCGSMLIDNISVSS
jgi:PmbA protein